MNKSEISAVLDTYNEEFTDTPLLIRSPGRINLIGEHTDYNDGFVLPAAINNSVYLAISKSSSDKVKIISNDLNEEHTFNINEPLRSGIQWADYLIGTTAEIKKSGYEFSGFNCVFGGDIPIGAGLSSSAAICAGLGFAINELFSLNIKKEEIAHIAQRAEHNFAGVKCGIMDQFVNLFGERNTALKLDCRSLKFEKIPFNYPSVSLVLCDSGIKHSLASSEYNIRRAQCEKGIDIIKLKYPEVVKLRDVSIDMLEEFHDVMPSEIYSRCIYVVEENARVHQACEYLKETDLIKFGELMSLTHEALRIDYEVSIPEIDSMVYAALDLKGVYGSRMMGGGFGGCTINLVESEREGFFKEKMQYVFRKSTGRELRFYSPLIESGTVIIH